ncbi:hypothetical protein ACHAXR_012969 [Thalassiosira sp. AJA248-18]
MPAAATTPPLIARSNDGSLIGIHHPDPTSTSKAGLVRCYDGNVSNGSLKFTLRLPPPPSSSTESLSGSSETNDDVLRKIVFSDGAEGGPSHLCGVIQSSTILVWDLDRGVLAQTVDIRAASAPAATKKKKKRKSSLNTTNGNEVVCDIAAAGNQLYALVFFPDGGDSGSTMGKCRLYQYDLSAKGATLVKKIKVGSVASSNDNAGATGSFFAVAISNATIAIRMGNLLRIHDLTSGEKLSKVDIPSDVVSSSSGDENDSSFVPLCITRDGRYIATGVNNQAILFSYDNKEDGDGYELQTMALLSTKDDSTIAHLDLNLVDNELMLLTFQPLVGIASIFAVSASSSTSSSSLVPQLPQSQLQTDEKDSSLTFTHAGFHPRKPNQAMLLLFQQAKSKSGSASGSGTNLPMESLPYGNGSLDGTVTVGTSLVLDNKNAKDGKKRKALDSVALAPGDQGQEASLATDLTLEKKKARVQQGDEDDDDFDDMEEDGEQGQSIAERLALLSSAMEQTDDEEGDEDDDDATGDEDGSKSNFKTKSATSETLTTLLTQALSSNDSTQLNIALQVTDRRLVEGTVRALQSLDAERANQAEDERGNTPATSGFISTLMAHIVRRMARRHSLVMQLGVWVKAILAATARSSTNRALQGGTAQSAAVEEQMAREGREMAMKLGPLKNFLNERVECFPQLLRLEGRLALLSQQL